jgi:hypothetical protein
MNLLSNLSTPDLILWYIFYAISAGMFFYLYRVILCSTQEEIFYYTNQRTTALQDNVNVQMYEETEVDKYLPIPLIIG